MSIVQHSRTACSQAVPARADPQHRKLIAHARGGIWDEDICSPRRHTLSQTVAAAVFQRPLVLRALRTLAMVSAGSFF